jgi:MraZ protein
VILSEGLKGFAKIGDAVTFVGHGHKFQLWEPETFRAHLEEARAAARDLRHRAGSAGAAA